MTTRAKGLWRLTVRDEFCAGHALRYYEGKCENTHGHNFAVEATVEGNTLAPGTELLLDFKVLKTCLKDVLEPLDHGILNDTPPFDDINPSSENLARHIFHAMAKRLQGLPVRLYAVTVSEKSSQSATYREL